MDIMGVDRSDEIAGFSGHQELLFVQWYFEHLCSQDKNVLRVRHI